MVDHTDGRYTLTAVVLAAGSYTLHAFIDERPAAPPWAFTVRAGAADAANSELTVGSTKGTIGRWTPLYVLGRDAYGNLAHYADAPVGDGEGGGPPADGGIEVHVIGGEGRAMAVRAVGDGRYESAVVAPVACLLRVAVTIHGAHLNGAHMHMPHAHPT